MTPKLKFSVITLFPDLISSFAKAGVFSQALNKQLELEIINPRSFTNDKHQSVDDRPFGGGDGMLMLAEPLQKAFESIGPGHRIYLSPQGTKLTEAKARELAGKQHLVLLCGRYGGVDQRLLNTHVDEEISIGDFVLSGGELAASVLMESVSRFVPEVLGHPQSAVHDSFSLGRLEEPHFTRPREILGQSVPEVLLSGDHARIQTWKEKIAWLVTMKKRPDLMQRLSLKQRQELRQYWRELPEAELKALGLESLLPRAEKKARVALGLLHYPILDREKDLVATNITNFDVHDIARAATVYGIERYYLIHPMQEQLMFVERILDHWRVGLGAKFNPYRRTALENVKTAKDLENALKDWAPDEKPLVIATHARSVPGLKTYSSAELKHLVFDQGRTVFLLFGTGFGMTDEYMSGLDGVLESIRGAPPYDYRHLSVRSAVSIYLDRILGPW